MKTLKMNVDIIFPPQFEPFQPYLAGAMLQSALNHAGFPSRYHDLNLSYYKFLLQETVSSLNASAGERAFKIDEYKSSLGMMETVLKTKRVDGMGIGFYDSTFGSKLYSGPPLVEVANGKWGEEFRSFLEQHSAFEKFDGGTHLFGMILVVHDQLPAALVLSQFIRENNPHAHICWGGPLVSRIGKEILHEGCLESYFDSLVMGAGESALPAICLSLSESNAVPSLPGVFLSGSRPSASVSLAPPTKSFLLPDFSAYSIDEYLSPVLVLPYLTSRGCYWGKCEFCCHYRPFDSYETDDVARIVNQLEHLATTHGVKHFSFSDEAIPVSILRKLSQEILHRDLNIRWFTFARLERGFDRATCELLHLAGCRILMFGFESAVQRVLDVMQKGTRVEDVVPILRNCAETGISIRLDVLIGFPTETREESEETLAFLLSHRDIIDTPFSVTPLSKFELQHDAPMQSYLERFGVKSRGPLRGPLDYQHAYSVASGMGPEESQEQYQRFIEVISKGFRAHARMPENKTHSFLMKCSYSDSKSEHEVFSDEISPDRLSDYRFDGMELVSLRHSDDHKWLLMNDLNGAQLKIGDYLATIVRDLQTNRCLTKPEFMDADCTEKIAHFLTYLRRQNFVNVSSKVDSASIALLRV